MIKTSSLFTLTLLCWIWCRVNDTILANKNRYYVSQTAAFIHLINERSLVQSREETQILWGLSQEGHLL